MPLDLVILQTCLPDYRQSLFEKLAGADPRIHLVCGQSYFTEGLALRSEPAPWRTSVDNQYYFQRSTLWQSGVLSLIAESQVVITEFNPRILSTWILLLRRWIKGRRTILWGHLWGQHGPKWVAQCMRYLMLKLSDGMICYTRSQQSELQRILPNLPSWAASNSCVTREQCMPTDPPETAPCVVYIGRLIREKKPMLLLEAFARAMPRLPCDAKLLLIGDGTERVGLEKRAQELGLTDRIELPGHIGDVERLRKEYARAVVAVSPGYVGLSAIQAMAFGVPMLVSRNESHSPEIEACVEGKTAEFFDTDNVDDLADRLAGFFASDSAWRHRRAEISSFIADNYTFDGMVEKFVEAINSVSHETGATQGETENSEGPGGRIAVVWAQFGPYHHSRLRTLRERFGETVVLGVEIGSLTATYGWQQAPANGPNFATLMPGHKAEDVPVTVVYQRALSLFREHKTRIVFVPSYWPASSLAIILAARNAGARVVMMNDSHAHTAKARGLWAEVKRRLVLQFDAALVAGAPQKDYFTGMGLEPGKIVTGYDAVDNEHFNRRAQAARTRAKEVRAKHGLPDRYFLNVGRMVWKKNLETLVDAYRVVKSKMGCECPRLVLVGSGKLERSLRERCLKHGLSVWQAAGKDGGARFGDADVLFHGFRQIDELPDFYALAECFILPSREEEWGLVVNEAMACGLPVLVSRVAGCARDLVREGENGFLFDPFDAAALAGHMERITREPELAKRLGATSQCIIADWGCERFAEAAKQAAEIALGTKIRDSGSGAMRALVAGADGAKAEMAQQTE